MYLDQTGEALAGVLRPGDAGSKTAQAHSTLLDQALAQLPRPTRRQDPELGPEVLVRSDSAGGSHGRLSRSGRRTILRLDANWPWARDLEPAFRHLRALPIISP